MRTYIQKQPDKPIQFIHINKYQNRSKSTNSSRIFKYKSANKQSNIHTTYNNVNTYRNYNNNLKNSQIRSNVQQFNNLYDARSIKSDQVCNSFIANSNGSRLSYAHNFISPISNGYGRVNRGQDMRVGISYGNYGNSRQAIMNRIPVRFTYDSPNQNKQSSPLNKVQQNKMEIKPANIQAPWKIDQTLQLSTNFVNNRINVISNKSPPKIIQTATSSKYPSSQTGQNNLQNYQPQNFQNAVGINNQNQKLYEMTKAYQPIQIFKNINYTSRPQPQIVVTPPIYNIIPRPQNISTYVTIAQPIIYKQIHEIHHLYPQYSAHIPKISPKIQSNYHHHRELNTQISEHHQEQQRNNLNRRARYTTQTQNFSNSQKSSIKSKSKRKQKQKQKKENQHKQDLKWQNLQKLKTCAFSDCQSDQKQIYEKLVGKINIKTPNKNNQKQIYKKHLGRIFHEKVQTVNKNDKFNDTTEQIISLSQQLKENKNLQPKYQEWNISSHKTKKRQSIEPKNQIQNSLGFSLYKKPEQLNFFTTFGNNEIALSPTISYKFINKQEKTKKIIFPQKNKQKQLTKSEPIHLYTQQQKNQNTVFKDYKYYAIVISLIGLAILLIIYQALK